MISITMRRSTVLANNAASKRSRTIVGYSCVDHDEKEIENDIKGRIKDHLNSFMNDPTRTDGLGRSSWPGVDGTPGDAGNSPLAHRKFFHYRGGECMPVSNVADILYEVGMELTICGKSVAEGLVHAMDKKGDESCVTWPEYLNSMFSIGPVSDTGAPDPTENDGVPQYTIYKEPERFSGYTRADQGGRLGSSTALSPQRAREEAKSSSSKTPWILGGIALAATAVVVFVRA